VAQWKAGGEGAPVEAVRARIDVAIRRLQALVTLPIGVRKDDQGKDIPAGQPETRERFSLLGSACKRKAWIAAPSERPAPLGEMRDWYRKAADRAQASGNILAYPTLNWIAALIALDWHGTPVPAGDRKRAETEMAELLPHLQRKVESRADMWDLASLADLELTAALWSGDLSASVDKLLADYDLVRRLASPREFESVREHLDFLLDMARDRNAAAAASLERLTRGLGEPLPASPIPKDEQTAEAEEEEENSRTPAPRGRARGVSRSVAPHRVAPKRPAARKKKA
jgi:hypothetical protein